MSTNLFNEIKDFYRDGLRRNKMLIYLIKYCGDREDAKDLLSECIAHLLEENAKGKLELIEKFDAYLRVVARNRFITGEKGKKGKQLKELIFHHLFVIENPEIPFNDDVEEKWIEQKNQDMIMQNIRQYVSEEVWQIMSRRIEGKSYQQIAEELSKNGDEVNAGQLRTKFSRGLAKLKEKINRMHPNIRTQLISTVK